MLNNPRTSERRLGFSLAELLVVIGIIAVLIAILLPVLSKVRAQANTARCIGNQRQLMQAMIAYAGDNDGFLPPPNWDGGAMSGVKGWLYNPPQLSAATTYQQTDVENGALYPYLNNLQVYRCYIDEGTYASNTVQTLTSYMMNGAVCDFGLNSVGLIGLPEKLSRFKANAILLWEIPTTIQITNGDNNDGADFPPEEITTRHQNGSTVGFVDGHAEQMTWTAFTNEWYYNAPGMLWCAPKANPNGVYDGGKSKWSAWPSSPPPQPSNAG